MQENFLYTCHEARITCMDAMSSVLEQRSNSNVAAARLLRRDHLQKPGPSIKRLVTVPPAIVVTQMKGTNQWREFAAKFFFGKPQNPRSALKVTYIEKQTEMISSNFFRQRSEVLRLKAQQ